MSAKDDKYTLVLNYIKGIPKQLLYIFMPSTPNGLEKLEAALLQKQLNRSEKIKAKILREANVKDLPLKARRWNLRYLKIVINIIALKKRMTNRWRDDNGGGLL